MTETTEHPLGAEHLPGCLALSKSAGWNQNEADWRLMLDIGHGWGISLADGTLAASTLVIPFEKFAWVSMVLVLPEHRRMGYASRLLSTAISFLEKQRLLAVLDATPAGREVYHHEGFRDAWSFSRLSLNEGFHREEEHREVRALRDSDWAWILELDSAAFGASRERLLRALARRLPQAALVVEGRGFLLGRDGRQANQLGPLVASDEQTARLLVSRALSTVQAPVYLDVVGHAPRLREWLEARGFRFQRPFTRMVRGAARAPGDENRVYLVAGPELG